MALRQSVALCLALANGALWTGWTVASGTWGMMPLNIVSAAVAWRNHRKWSLEQRPGEHGLEYAYRINDLP